jgi:hypothetical protein
MQTIKNFFTGLINFFTNHTKIMCHYNMRHYNMLNDDAKKTIRESDEYVKVITPVKIIDNDRIITVTKSEKIEMID